MDENSVLTGVLTFISTMSIAYLKMRRDISKKKAEATKEVRLEFKQRLHDQAEAFKKQIEAQQKAHDTMLKSQKKSFEHHKLLLDGRIKELTGDVENLETELKRRLEQLLDISVQNANKSGKLEVLENDK